MNFIKRQFHELRLFYRHELKWPLPACAAAFLLIVVISGFAFAQNSELAAAIMRFFSENISESVLTDDGGISAPGLLINNLRACFSCIILGFLPFLFLPALSMVVNAGVIGAMLGLYAVNGYSIWRLSVFGLLPHGIFELPALFIAFACGFSLCLTMCRAVVRLDGGLIVPELKNLARVFVINIIPLLILAAAAETYITPLLLNKYVIM